MHGAITETKLKHKWPMKECQMNAAEDYIKKVEMQLPDKCTVKDLMRVGIYNCATAAVEARVMGDCPVYFQLRKRGRIFYPKAGVIEWLREKINAKYSENVICSDEKTTPSLPQ